MALRIGRVIAGRTPDNDVQIDSRFISRHHCQVITTPHSCVVEDLNSTNGILREIQPRAPSLPQTTATSCRSASTS